MTLLDSLKPAFRAVIVNWKPMLLIQVGAIALVLTYYQSPGLQAWCVGLAGFKERGGLPFAAIAGAIAGGIVPEVAKFLTNNRAKPQSWREVACVAAYFACMGLSVDIMYTGMGHLYGMDHHVVTVLKKTATDMGLFCPICAVTTTVLVFTWKDYRFSWPATKAAFRDGGYFDRYIKVLLPNWMIWIPVISAIYSLPVNLQFLTAQLAEAAWSLVVVHISQGENEQVKA
ncbi:MAG: hypothetical protein P4L46_21130 [Fimbriimonas sp.]|nr:hypothetical protein [Fimbriimonas sp.]